MVRGQYEALQLHPDKLFRVLRTERHFYEANERFHLRQHRTIMSSAFGGSFAPILQFEKLEIHKVFLRFPNFILEQNLSPKSLAKLCGAALKTVDLRVCCAAVDPFCHNNAKAVGWQLLKYFFFHNKFCFCCFYSHLTGIQISVTNFSVSFVIP